MNRMSQCLLTLFLLSLSCLFVAITASSGDTDPIYISCVEQCKKTGCVGEKCFQHCKFSPEGKPIDDGPWYVQEPLYQRWKHWDCQGDCRYHCMIVRESERKALGDAPIKYHGKWPFKHVYGIQEPVSVALSALSLAIQFHGWVSFFILINYKLPARPDKKSYYEFTGLLHIYGIIAMNAWFWSTVFHSRDVGLTEKLDYSSAVALLGYSLIFSIVRAFNMRDEATRVMVAAPLVAFVTTHILYLNLYQLDTDLHTKVCLAIGTIQFMIWATWASLTHSPSRWKLWGVVIGSFLSLLFEVYDFPPYLGYVDGHALWHLTAVPVSYLFWSFFRDDAEFRTATLLKKAK
ncbi:post-GPI attachment to proteins factor 3-like [Impatiens glandulifera]|uniref:post-GPI attachment to proteins factor 3-like n=1 Tax=Impatiens glandulifera TaxID=253017 RepID=UPI001FB11BB3|nr:post-GPI attachment to proteins factor 3-like [Impatiens glandulifera]